MIASLLNIGCQTINSTFSSHTIYSMWWLIIKDTLNLINKVGKNVSDYIFISELKNETAQKSLRENSIDELAQISAVYTRNLNK